MHQCKNRKTRNEISKQIRKTLPICQSILALRSMRWFSPLPLTNLHFRWRTLLKMASTRESAWVLSFLSGDLVRALENMRVDMKVTLTNFSFGMFTHRPKDACPYVGCVPPNADVTNPLNNSKLLSCSVRWGLGATACAISIFANVEKTLIIPETVFLIYPAWCNRNRGIEPIVS